MRLLLRIRAGLLTICLVAITFGPAFADKPDCKGIDSAPFVIRDAGRWCIARDLVLADPAGTAISIDADGVSLDLGGHCIYGGGEKASRAVGIYIPHGRREISIANGCVNGFMYGIHADTGTGTPSSHISIEQVRLANNRFRGIVLYAEHATVQRTTVMNTGGTTVFEDAYAIGIEVHHDHCRISENVLRDVYASGSGEGVGISLSGIDTDNCIVEGNFASNSRQPETGQTIGLWSSSKALVRSNTFVNHTYSISGKRTPENTVRNIAIGENCYGIFYSKANEGTDTLYIPMPLTVCPDTPAAALAKLDWNKRDTLFRLGRVLHYSFKYEEAIPYYKAAARLGSTEAQRRVEWLEQELGRK